MAIIKEIWKDVKGYESIYQVSDLGNIKSVPRTIIRSSGVKCKIKSTTLNKAISYGYEIVTLFNVGSKSKTVKVHRLVATAFITNPENKRTVNHKDGDKQNNNMNNLEWNTYSENIKHSYDKLGRKGAWAGKFGSENHLSKAVLQYDLNNIFIAKYASATCASAKLGIGRNNIVEVLSNRNITAGGYKWKYNTIS